MTTGRINQVASSSSSSSSIKPNHLWAAPPREPDDAGLGGGAPGVNTTSLVLDAASLTQGIPKLQQQQWAPKLG